jgi:transcriptional regulator with XRE-family HTH domain
LFNDEPYPKYMNYGKALKIGRAVAGISQKELASKAELDPSHVSLIEKGQRKPSVGAVHKLAEALEIPEHLFTLLAAEPNDLRNIDAPELGRISESLARYVIGETRSREKSRRRNPAA